jgi:hypothetical protein
MNKITFILIFLLSLHSCYDEIDLPIPRGQAETNTVIIGDLIKGEFETSITVFFAVTAGKQSFSELIRVNSVIVENDLGQKIKLEEANDGSYYSKIANNDPSFSTANGRRIRLFAIDYSNNEIASNYQHIVNGPSFDSLWYRVENKKIKGPDNIEEEAEFINVFGNLLKSKDGVIFFYYNFDHHYLINEQVENEPITRTCYITEKIKSPLVQFNANEINPSGAMNFPLLSIQSNNNYSDNSFITVTLNAINEDAYNHRSQLAELIKNDNTIFSNPKDKIVSNFSVKGKPQTEVFGYFNVVTQATKRIKILANDFKKIKKECPSELDENGNCVRRQCCNCLIVKGSSLERPYFWN